jgi:SAM-dependent methyltransferase
MKQSINFDSVADLYDWYVNVDFDIPFFLKETEKYTGEILELMCGTGRVSIPLLETGRKMTCVDYSKRMLEIFSRKIANKHYHVNIVHMDATDLDLKKKYGIILLPFHSLTEILSTELQQKALKAISLHLNKNGILILTLQNPKTRLKLADGATRIFGNFSIGHNRRMIVSFMNQYNPSDKIVSGFQFYEIYDTANNMIEKRILEINFKPIMDTELKGMLQDLDLEVIETYGDYSYSRFDEESSEFMIYKIMKKER